MANILPFPTEKPSRFGFQRIKSTYTVREISEQFGLSESRIRRWTHDGLIETVVTPEPGEMRYDFRALRQFRRVRELRGQGLTLKQIDAELRGQLNLFPEAQGQLIPLATKLTPFEEALLLHESGDEKAAEAFRKAIRENDCVPDAYCNLGILEFEGGQMAKAFDCFTSSLKHDPRHFESHYNLGNLYFEAGDNRLARLHYEMAAELEPSFPSLYFNLGLVHALTGDLSAAAAALHHYQDLAPDDKASKVEELLARLEAVMTCQR